AIEKIFVATSPSAKTLRPEERQPFKERWLGRYIEYDIESFFVAITELSTVAGYLAGCLDNPAHNPRFADIGYYASVTRLALLQSYPWAQPSRTPDVLTAWSKLIALRSWDSWIPLGCRHAITSDQHDPSAKSPWTSTTFLARVTD